LRVDSHVVELEEICSLERSEGTHGCNRLGKVEAKGRKDDRADAIEDMSDDFEGAPKPEKYMNYVSKASNIWKGYSAKFNRPKP
jgi:hypothetical protein